MYSKINSKYLACIILSTILVSNTSPISANAVTTTTMDDAPTLPSAAEHQRTMNHFINPLISIHSRLFQLVQLPLENTPQSTTTLNQNIALITTEITRLRGQLRTYLSELPPLSTQNRDVLLLFNVLNYTESALVSLSGLPNTPSSVERVILLSNFFDLRTSALRELNVIQSFLTQQ